MTQRRPLRPSGVETIGWLELSRLLPRTGWLLVEHGVRIVPCWATWLRRGRRPNPDASSLKLPLPPQTAWAKAVDSHVVSIGMDERWVRHSRRTWQFAAALSDIDNAQLDPELLYVGSMLHDSGLFEPNPGSCFAVEGAAHARRTAAAAGADDQRANTVAEAIASHISIKPDNELGRYLQYGSLLDLTGNRLWRLDRDLVDRICLAEERTGLPKEAREQWRAECVRFPHGRAAYVKRPGGFMLASRLAPLPS